MQPEDQGNQNSSAGSSMLRIRSNNIAVNNTGTDSLQTFQEVTHYELYLESSQVELAGRTSFFSLLMLTVLKGTIQTRSAFCTHTLKQKFSLAEKHRSV